MNRFYDLPDVLQEYILEFDPTHKENHKTQLNKVFRELETMIFLVWYLRREGFECLVSERKMRLTLRGIRKPEVRQLARITRTPLPKKFTKRRATIKVIINLWTKRTAILYASESLKRIYIGWIKPYQHELLE